MISEYHWREENLKYSLRCFMIAQNNTLCFPSYPFNHAILILYLEKGDVYTWGQNVEGQCGFNMDDEIKEPRKHNFDERVVSISCGYYHTALVTGKKVLFYMFRKNYYTSKEGISFFSRALLLI